MNDLLALLDEAVRAVQRGDPRALAGALVLGSMLLHAMAANIAWHYRVSPSSRLSRRLAAAAVSLPARMLLEVLRLGYYLVVPGIALNIGWVDLRALGLAYLDWADGLRWAIVLGLAAWSLLMFVWVPYLRATTSVPLPDRMASLTWSRRVVETIYMQAHWALYRAACILILSNYVSDQSAIYWGTMGGIGLVLLEAWADPRVRRQVGRVGEGEIALWSAGQAIVNAVGFVMTRNAWLVALLGLTLEFTVPHLRRVRRPQAHPISVPIIPPTAPAKKQGAP